MRRSSVILRTRGFKEQLADENKAPDVDLKIVAQLPGGGEREKAVEDADARGQRLSGGQVSDLNR